MPLIESFNVFKEHRDGDRDQVLDREWSRHGEISQRNEIRLLGVEVNVASNAVGVCIQSKKDLIVVAVNHKVVSSHLRAQNNRLLLKNLSFILKKTYLGFLRPFELRLLLVHRAGCFAHQRYERAYLYTLEVTGLERDYH